MIWLLFGLFLLNPSQNDPATVDQPAPPSMKFEVASIRPVKMEPGQSLQQGGGFLPSNSSHLRLTNWPVISILKEAFSLPMIYQVAGYDKLSSIPPLYDIQAVGDEASDKKLAELPKDQRRAEQNHMLQALLLDRFQLKFHWEDRLVPGYRLVIAKHGPKLLPAGSLPIDPATLRMRGDDGKMLAMHLSHDELGHRVFVGRGATIADLVRITSAFVNSPIQDETGLDGKYDFDLRIGDRPTESITPGGPNDQIQEDPNDQIIDAVQEQLGLRLEAARTVQKVFVIDHVEAPSPN
jgi:uncharacterized protein (TIGR03435 family)